MAVNKIKISTSTRKILNKTKRTLGIQGENMKDVLFFALSEKIDGTAVVEIELPNGVQSFVELIKVEDGYELPVKSVLTEQAGFVKFQLRILQNKVEVFKSEIFELEVKESLNAIYEEPEEYPTWLDKLEDLQTELNNSEKERISNENERIESEEARKENFTQMQKSVKGAISNIKDLTENYNLNATEKTNKFDENYTEKKKAFDDNYSETLKSFNDNAETKYDNYNKNAENKTSEYNKNNDEKLKTYNDNHTTKITNFDTNAKNKTDEYNSNASKKLDDYNSNDTTKTEKYNENATTKLSDYNSNATAKKKEYDTNAENKIVEFNNNAAEKLDEYNQNSESLTNRISDCEEENERLRNDIKSIALQGEASGENIHIEDSSNARCEIEIGGNHQQETRSGKNRINLGLLGSGTLNGVTYTYNESNQSITFNGTCTKDNTRFIINDNANIQTIAKKTTLTAQYLAGSVSNYFTARIADNEWKHNLLLSLLALNSSNNKVSLTETEDMVGVHIDIKANSGTIFNNFTIQLMLTDEVDTDYEMYGASPSLDYTSPVKSVGNIKNILDMSNAKNGASAGIICTTNADGSYKYKGTATSQYINVWFMGGYATDLPTLFTLEPGTYYINDVSLFEGTTGFANDSSKKIWTFIRAYNVTGVRAPNAVSGNTYDETKYPIIAKIDHEIPWVPYDCGYAKVNIQNKNIAPIFNLGTNWKYTDKGIKNTITSAEKEITKFKLKAGQTIKIGFKLFSKPSQDTTFTWYVNNVSNIISSFGHIDRTTFELNKIYTRTYTAKEECVIRSKMFGNANNDIFEFQVWAEYDNLTEYKKYEEQSYLVDVQQPMLEGDKFVKIDEKWYEKHNFDVISTLNKSNIKVTKSSTSTDTFFRYLLSLNAVNRKEGIGLKIYSTHFINKNSRWARVEGICGWESGTTFCLGTFNAEYDTEEKVTNFLQNTDVKIYYELAEPILLECTEAQSKVLDEIYNTAHTYKNITNISAESAEVNPIINVKYLKDTETEHNKLQAQIDEIKQLLSTTETSALLLDNIQKELESEV